MMKKKVLIVDDEPEQIEFAAMVMQENGHIPISASDGEEGMKKVHTEKPDLILLDILMPRKSGLGMYRDLKQNEKTRNIPVVIVTGVARGGDLQASMIRQEDLPPPDGYVEKPMNPDAVSKLVNDLLS
jgi:two-component system phosphate regulon response regulator PhoB